jgi:hypothetical protein
MKRREEEEAVSTDQFKDARRGVRIYHRNSTAVSSYLPQQPHHYPDHAHDQSFSWLSS